MFMNDGRCPESRLRLEFWHLFAFNSRKKLHFSLWNLTCQKSTSHAPSFSSVKEYRFLSMMEIFDFQHPENVNIFMMLKNCSLFRQYPTPLPALAGSSWQKTRGISLCSVL